MCCVSVFWKIKTFHFPKSCQITKSLKNWQNHGKSFSLFINSCTKTSNLINCFDIANPKTTQKTKILFWLRNKSGSGNDENTKCKQIRNHVSIRKSTRWKQIRMSVSEENINSNGISLHHHLLYFRPKHLLLQ